MQSTITNSIYSHHPINKSTSWRSYAATFCSPAESINSRSRATVLNVEFLNRQRQTVDFTTRNSSVFKDAGSSGNVAVSVLIFTRTEFHLSSCLHQCKVIQSGHADEDVGRGCCGDTHGGKDDCIACVLSLSPDIAYADFATVRRQEVAA